MVAPDWNKSSINNIVLPSRFLPTLKALSNAVTLSEKSPISFICGVAFVLLSEVVSRAMLSSLLKAEAISMTGWKGRCDFDGGIGMITSFWMFRLRRNDAAAATIAGMAFLSPLYFRR